MLGLALAGIVLAFSNSGVVDRGLELCVDNQAHLDTITMQVFRTELTAILTASDRTAEFGPCRAGSVRITMRSTPPDAETSALGAARRKDGKILPELELYVDGVTQLVNIRLPGVIGRALARVATHEMGHYLYQGGHAGEGLMMERLGAAHLLAADRSFFRLAPPRPRN